jgi:hypothetical protein
MDRVVLEVHPVQEVRAVRDRQGCQDVQRHLVDLIDLEVRVVLELLGRQGCWALIVGWILEILAVLDRLDFHRAQEVLVGLVSLVSLDCRCLLEVPEVRAIPLVQVVHEVQEVPEDMARMEVELEVDRMEVGVQGIQGFLELQRFQVFHFDQGFLEVQALREDSSQGSWLDA